MEKERIRTLNEIILICKRELLELCKDKDSSLLLFISSATNRDFIDITSKSRKTDLVIIRYLFIVIAYAAFKTPIKVSGPIVSLTRLTGYNAFRQVLTWWKFNDAKLACYFSLIFDMEEIDTYITKQHFTEKLNEWSKNYYRDGQLPF